MAAPRVETIWLVNGFKRHIVMAAPIAVSAPSSVWNLMKSSSRRFDGKSRSLDDRDYVKIWFRFFCMQWAETISVQLHTQEYFAQLETSLLPVKDCKLLNKA